MRRLRSQAGVTLVELLVAMTLMTIVLGTTLTAFDALQGDHKTTEKHTEAITNARQTMDRLARQLRNLASPGNLTNVASAQPRAVERATPYDLVFRTVDESMPAGSANSSNVMRMRYCVAENPSNKKRWRMYVQTQRWTQAATPSMPDVGSCPATGGGWGTQALYTTQIVNKTHGAVAVPVFTYAPACANVDACTADELRRITKVRSQLIIDNDPDARPAPTRLTSSVILRNQNQFPTALFEIEALDLANRKIRLNASAATDPDGQAMRYCWFANAPTPLPTCTGAASHTGYLGEGVLLDYTVPSSGTWAFSLVVEDPAGLVDDETQTRSF